MHRPSLLLTLLALLLAGFDPGRAAAARAGRPVRDTAVVFVAWGSSNACGWGRPGVGAQGPSPVPLPGSAFEMYHDVAVTDPVPLLDPAPCRSRTGHEPGNMGSAWAQFAVSYHAATGHTVFLSSMADAGTALLPQPGPDWNVDSDELYREGLDLIRTAVAEAERFFGRNHHDGADTTVVFGGVLWMHGNDLGPGPSVWAAYRSALSEVVQRTGEDALNRRNHPGHGGRFYLVNTPVPRDLDYFGDAMLRRLMDQALELEAEVCAAFPHCTLIRESVTIKAAQQACGGNGSLCGGWYSPGYAGDGIHWGQDSLNLVGEATATAAARDPGRSARTGTPAGLPIGPAPAVLR
jgi:hypothetical protein